MRPSALMGRAFVLGLSGASCSGKSMLGKALLKDDSVLKTFDAKVYRVCQDDFYWPEESVHHVHLTEPRHIDWERIGAFDMKSFVQHVQNLRLKDDDKMDKLIVLDGLLLFADEATRELCDLKLFLTLSKSTFLQRRAKRVYEPPDVPGYAENVVHNAHQQHLQWLKSKFADEIVFLSGENEHKQNFEVVKKLVLDKWKDLNT